MTVVLEPLDWFIGSAPNTAYRECDRCGESAIADFLACVPPCGYRHFYGHDGLSICENCLERYLAETHP